MSKLITLTLFLAAAIALATAADEKYFRLITYKDNTCTGPEVATMFRSTECLFYDAAYTYYDCKADGVYRNDCGTDSYCTSCTSSKVTSFDCANFAKASCTNDEYNNLYNANAPITFQYAQQDCKSKNLLAVTVYNTSSVNSSWGECSNGEFYLNSCANGNCTTRVKQAMECTWETTTDISTEHECGWPNSAAQLAVGAAAILSVAALLF
jgi:hypothetical protein